MRASRAFNSSSEGFIAPTRAAPGEPLDHGYACTAASRVEVKSDRGFRTMRARSVPPQLPGIAAAIEIKRVVEMSLAADCFMIVVALRGGEPLESFRDRLKAG
jgi:hypothetical protein